jgi:ribosomal protein L37AE/L43A
MAGLGGPPEAPEEEKGADGEAKPPLSTCPGCGGDGVEIRSGGEWNCEDCGAEGTAEIVVHMTKLPGTLEETEKGTPDAGGADEGGIGDAAGGAGLEMPAGASMQTAFLVTPNVVKVAGNKPIGSFCPHCGSNQVKTALKQGCGTNECKLCGGSFDVKTEFDLASKALKATLTWKDMAAERFAASKIAAIKEAAAKQQEIIRKKAQLNNALQKTGLIAKFAKADTAGKAQIIATFKAKGLITE